MGWLLREGAAATEKGAVAAGNAMMSLGLLHHVVPPPPAPPLPGSVSALLRQSCPPSLLPVRCWVHCTGTEHLHRTRRCQSPGISSMAAIVLGLEQHVGFTHEMAIQYEPRTSDQGRPEASHRRMSISSEWRVVPTDCFPSCAAASAPRGCLTAAEPRAVAEIPPAFRKPREPLPLPGTGRLPERRRVVG